MTLLANYVEIANFCIKFDALTAVFWNLDGPLGRIAIWDYESRAVWKYQYVIYKPQLVGVYHKYMKWVQGQSKFATDKPWARRGGVTKSICLYIYYTDKLVVYEFKF